MMISVMEEIAELTHARGLLTVIVNAASSAAGDNLHSVFSSTSSKPSLGPSFTFCADVTLFIQETGRVFGLMDEGERERSTRQPGFRAVVEVIKSRVSEGGRWAVFETTDGVNLWDVVAPEEDDERTVGLSRGLPGGTQRPRLGGLSETLAR